jgi:hypothetical protein
MTSARNQRGVTIVELLMAVLLATIVIAGVGSFYWRMIRSWVASNDQVAMQRQATLVQQEISRIVIASNGTLPGTCGPVGNPASLPVRVPVQALPETATAQKHFCFYWVANPGGIVECEFNPSVATTCSSAGRNLLLGDPTPQNIQATAVAFTVVNNSVVDFAVTLRAVDGTAVLAGPLTFAARVFVRN